MEEEIGIAEFLGVEEYGGQLVTVLRGKDSDVASIVLRGASRPFLEEIERAINDGVAIVKSCTKNNEFLAGAGAVEMELAQQIEAYSATLSGLEQYSVEQFAQAMTTFGIIIAENAGQNAMETYAQLHADHKANKRNHGVDVTVTTRKSTTHIYQKLVGDVTRDMTAVSSTEPESSYHKHLLGPVYDHHMTKIWAIKLAVDSACTVLRVDQIIMAKPAGGPKTRET